MLIYNTPNIIPVNSSAMQLENMVIYSIQIVFTGTPSSRFCLSVRSF